MTQSAGDFAYAPPSSGTEQTQAGQQMAGAVGEQDYIPNGQSPSLWDDAHDRFNMHFQPQDQGALPVPGIHKNRPIPGKDLRVGSRPEGRFVPIGGGKSAFSKVGNVTVLEFGTRNAPGGSWYAAKPWVKPVPSKDPYDFESEIQNENRYPFGGSQQVAHHPTLGPVQIRGTTSVTGNAPATPTGNGQDARPPKRPFDSTFPYHEGAAELNHSSAKRQCPSAVCQPMPSGELLSSFL